MADESKKTGITFAELRAMTPEERERACNELIAQAQTQASGHWGPDRRHRAQRCIDALYVLMRDKFKLSSQDMPQILKLIDPSNVSYDPAIEALRALIAHETDGRYGEDKKGGSHG